MTRTWWCIGIAGRIIMGLFVVLIVFGLSLPFLASFPAEFVDVSDERASHYLAQCWQGVDLPKGLEKASGKIYSQIDCRADWYKLVLPPTDAAEWQESIHEHLEKSARLGRGVEFIEGVHRTVTGPILGESHLGSAPQWWHPPSSSFQVTERMRWYSGATTYADAVYSAFDPSTNTLWVFKESQQHGRYWTRGTVPAGRQFVLGPSVEKERPNGEIE